MGQYSGVTSFRYRALPMRVVFGPGRLAELPAELDDLGQSRALVLATPGHRALAARVNAHAQSPAVLFGCAT